MKKTIGGLLCMVVAVFFAVGTVHPGTAWSAGSAWILLDGNTTSAFFYDKKGVMKPKEGIVRITARTLYTEEGKADVLQTLKPATLYANLSESHYVYDLDCAGHKSKLLSVTHLDDSGDKIKTYDLAAVTDWEEIPVAARLELITDLVCPKQ